MSIPCQPVEALRRARRARQIWTCLAIGAFLAYIPLNAVKLLDAPVLGFALFATWLAGSWHGWIRAHEGGKP